MITMIDRKRHTAHIPCPPRGVALFYWVRLNVWRTSLHELTRAPVKLGVIITMWSVLLVGMYALSYRGIRFIYDTAGLGPFLLNRLWFLFLFVVMVMLAVSQLASVYSTLVRAPETRWWMGLPVSARTLCRAKWLESSFYSAWAVVVLVLPMWLASLAVLQQPFWRVGWVVLILLIPLIGIVTALATTVLLVWLRWLGHITIRRELIPVGFVLACSMVFWLLGEQQGAGGQDVWFLALQELLPRMQIAMSMWLPSSWAATGLDAGLNGRWIEGVRYAALLWMTMLLCWRALDHVAAGLLLPVLRHHAQPLNLSPVRLGTKRPLSAEDSRGKSEEMPLTWWMRRPFLASLTKDILLVIRDPMQWSQAVVFFGLLGAYFANIHRLAQISVEPSWRIGVASLNLACTLLVFGSLAVRFIFPQMSLEGRSLWLLRMAPHGMRRLMCSKLCLYGVIAVCLIEGLLMLSASRLGVPSEIRWWLAGVGVLAALTLVGLTVGLGAWWIDLTARDAARVVSSSNGALVLVFMLCYVGCVVATLVAVWTHWLSGSFHWLAIATLGLVAASLIAGVIPVRGGIAKLEHLEYAV
jgi:ABC-2 type transport system permease protein